MANGYGVEPSAAAWTACNCAVLAASFTNPLANFVIKLSWEWATADPSGIGFDDPDPVLNLTGVHA
jgi:hypothetical protein